METLKKLRDEMQRCAVPGESQSVWTINRWIATLDAYIKAQESAEPAGWFHEMLDHEGTKNGVLLGVRGADRKSIVEQAHEDGETDPHVFALYASPQPREPIAWWDGDKSDPSLSFNGPTTFETIPLFTAPPPREPITREALEKALSANAPDLRAHGEYRRGYAVASDVAKSVLPSAMQSVDRKALIREIDRFGGGHTSPERVIEALRALGIEVKP